MVSTLALLKTASTLKAEKYLHRWTLGCTYFLVGGTGELFREALDLVFADEEIFKDRKMIKPFLCNQSPVKRLLRRQVRR